MQTIARAPFGVNGRRVVALMDQLNLDIVPVSDADVVYCLARYAAVVEMVRPGLAVVKDEVRVSNREAEDIVTEPGARV